MAVMVVAAAAFLACSVAFFCFGGHGRDDAIERVGERQRRLSLDKPEYDRRPIDLIDLNKVGNWRRRRFIVSFHENEDLCGWRHVR